MRYPLIVFDWDGTVIDSPATARSDEDRGGGPARVDAVAVTYGAHPEHQLRSCAPRGCVASVEALGRWLSENV